MRTTLDLPEDLVIEAMKSIGAKTKTAVIIEALKEIIRKSKIEGLLKFRGKVDLEIDLNSLRTRE
jgi:Arc/MetJ family transcription regulator